MNLITGKLEKEKQFKPFFVRIEIKTHEDAYELHRQLDNAADALSDDDWDNGQIIAIRDAVKEEAEGYTTQKPGKPKKC